MTTLGNHGFSYLNGDFVTEKSGVGGGTRAKTFLVFLLLLYSSPPAYPAYAITRQELLTGAADIPEYTNLQG